MVRPRTSNTKGAKRDRRRRQRLGRTGVCNQCFKNKPRSDFKSCEDCTFKTLARDHLGSRRMWRQLREILERQGYRCAYTGVPIDLGAGASVDHVHAQSTHPEHRHSPENIRWVHREVNTAKNNLSLSDFLNMCKSVLSHFGYAVLKDDQ